MQTSQTLAEGRFSLHSLLGEGGMARVYRAYDHRLKRWRAVKVLLPEFTRRQKIRKRFEAEAQALARLEHPNVVRIYDVGATQDQSWIIMELCEGGSLEDWLQNHGPMPPRMAVRTLLAVCDGIEAAHREGILHRDIKPHNVLVSRKGVPKVTDFGIAHFETSDLTRTGAAMGTDGYMAPEQRENAKTVGPPSDIYSLGATLYSLVTDRIDPHLFAADHEPEKLEGIPEALAAVIARCTAYRADDRYASITALRQALVSTLPGLPPNPADTPGLVWRPLRVPEAPAAPPTIVPKTGAEATTGGDGTLMPVASTMDIAPTDPEPVVEDSLDASPLDGALAPPTAPEPLFHATPEGVQRAEAPGQVVREGNIERVKYGGFEVIYEDPVDERYDDSQWSTSAVGPIPSERRELDRRAREGDWDDIRDNPSGVGWAARESWGFVTQILTTALKAIGNPAGFALPGVMAVGLLLAVAMFAQALRGSAILTQARDAWLMDVQTFEAALESDAELRETLVERGANQELLDAAVARYEAAQTPEEKLEAAEALASVMAAELAVLETRGELELREQRALKRRMLDIQEKRRAIDQSEARWREMARTMSGRVAAGCGRGALPPEDDG